MDELPEEDPNGIPKRARKNCIYFIFYKICTHSIFGGAVIFFIIANTLILALDKHPQPDAMVTGLELGNEILSWCFFTEMILKLIGLGPVIYSKDKFNLFDATIVIISLIESIISWADVGSGVSTGGALSAFRGVRLLRVFKLARSWKSF